MHISLLRGKSQVKIKKRSEKSFSNNTIVENISYCLSWSVYCEIISLSISLIPFNNKLSVLARLDQADEDISDNNNIMSFLEKPKGDGTWINGGFFIIEPKFFDFIDDDSTLLEREPLEKASSRSQLMAFKHKGFWQCMDTKRDRDMLEELWRNNDVKWVQKNG